MERYVVRNIDRPDKSIIEQFSKLDVSTVYEAQGKTGLVSHELKTVKEGNAICGPAVTVTCFAGDNLMIHAAIEVCKPGDVLVITTIGESTTGMIGELIIHALMKRGVQGVVTEAGIRDAARIRECGFPVWSRAIHSQGSTKSRGGWVNAPTVCGGASVNPGDLVMADDDGVVFVKREDLKLALESSNQRMSKEEDTKARIERGELSLDFYSLRGTLEKENVVYYENEEARASKK
ncbi:4-carboxy-4-hydroxy-2-oxoadipate aldolase/oxaloacetate decarboxylase [Paenibacillus radicis (ex Xue et al. 2023)]|uniref:Putative 4-hydroxy-4-methyl-2-oxoglutarate aldolase n=1 Tax=Paenibacillus radicis (ex Xue et al. 2023) TaxID=2972489 RepID=A0ABT1YR69_9BACL|nr:4-carboxy-4-hydroxy-2-oxoadipate aldolase/oxaloacetate decarboxylase [Paenibacillus radicis (ex Xue et al. 2023)]MCR8635679.1 4-carboxy-4-hydroxy-2-oxoadipate aldolase/oxaloacetate decarboxylase [Paenibacillus radicis (ex Xue et al. 2023)]